MFDFSALTTNYRRPRTGRQADRYSEIAKRSCEARRDDLIQCDGAGSVDAPARTQRATAKQTRSAGDDDGDSDPDGEPEIQLISRDQIDTLVDVLVTALEHLKPKKLEETLWDVEQIAQWLGLSKVTVDTRVVTRPGFPEAFRPVESKQAQRRWFASDVHQWARMNTGAIPTTRPGRKRRTA